MSKSALNGKPVKFVSTANWSNKYGGIEGAMYIKEALACLTRHPVDMLVFEQPEAGKLHIRSAGYDLATGNHLDETTVLFKSESLPIDTFWLKLDDLEDEYLGTFLFPDEY